MAEIKKYLDSVALGTLVDQIKAEDAKVLSGAKTYADGLAKNYDAAGAAATAESNAKAYTDELANGQVATNKADIAKLNGDVNTDGSVAKAIATAKAAIDADVDAVEGIANKNKEDIAAINNAESGILAQAKAYADGEVEKVQGEVDALELYVGTIPEGATSTNVVAYVQEKTAGIATSENLQELTNRVAQAETDIDNIEKDYLKAADKTTLEGKITDVETAVATEKSRAEGIEAGLETRLAKVEGDYLKAADKTELQGNIDTLTGVVNTLRDGVDAEKVDGVKDLIDYVEEHGTEVTGMKEDISENAAAVAAVAGRMDTAEGEIDALQTAVAGKVEQTAYDAKIAELAGADTTLSGRIDTLEAKFGEGDGSVEDLIADAKAEAISAAASDAATKDEAILAAAKQYADDEDAKVEERVATLETASAKHALASDLTALTGRVETAEGEIDTLQSEMDAVEAKAAANETAIGNLQTAVNGKVAQGDFDTLSGKVTAAEGKITTLEGTVADKAEQDDLDAALERITAVEGVAAANTSAINSFTAITSAEVEALFA